MLSKTIKFSILSKDKDYFPNPVPASRILPEWYKNTKRYPIQAKGSTSDNSGWINFGGADGENTTMNQSIKGCVPVLDALSAGYIITLQQDIHALVTEDSEGDKLIEFSWKRSPRDNREVMSTHPHWQFPLTPLKQKIKEDSKTPVFKYLNAFAIKTPPGYSCYFTKPIMRDTKGIEIFSGIVDTDSYEGIVNFPFDCNLPYGNHIIPMGTPIVQIIPFKRENWNHEIVLDDGEIEKASWNIDRVFKDGYRNLFWHKKKWK